MALSASLVGILADALAVGNAPATWSRIDELATVAEPLDERVLLLDADAQLLYANTAARRDFTGQRGSTVVAPALPAPVAATADAADRSWSIRATDSGCLVVHAAAAPGDDPA